MKKNIFACFALMISCAFAFSQTGDEKLLKLAEDRTAFYGTDFKGTYSIVQKIPGEGERRTDAVMYRRDSEKKWTILVTGPAHEKGKGYLQFDGKIWFYDPVDKRFTFSSAKDKFQNSNVTNSDFAPQKYYSDYNIASASDALLGSYKCRMFVLKAKNSSAEYPEVHIWVSVDDGLVRKKEDYSLSGQVLRTTGVQSFQIVKNGSAEYAVPAKMVIVDGLKGKKISGKIQYERTQVTISNVSFSKVADSVYSKPYLEMMSAK